MGTRMGVVKSPNVQSLRIKVPKRDQFRGEGAAMESTTLLSKLRDAVRSRSRIDAGFCFGHVPLPLGEGRREAPGEGRKCTLIRPFGPPSPRGSRTRASISANLDTTADKQARSIGGNDGIRNIFEIGCSPRKAEGAPQRRINDSSTTFKRFGCERSRQCDTSRASVAGA